MILSEKTAQTKISNLVHNYILETRQLSSNNTIHCTSTMICIRQMENTSDHVVLLKAIKREAFSGNAICSVQFSSVQSLSRVQLFATPWITARQASLSITNSWSSLKLMSIKSVMPSSHSSSVTPFTSCSQSLLASGYFPVSQLFEWGGQSIGVSASASVLPMYTQDWSPLE